MLGRLINDTYFKALDEHAIPAVADPRSSTAAASRRGQPFTYQAEIEVKPEVTAKDYTGLDAAEGSLRALIRQMIDGASRRCVHRRAQLKSADARSGCSPAILS